MSIILLDRPHTQTRTHARMHARARTHGFPGVFVNDVSCGVKLM